MKKKDREQQWIDEHNRLARLFLEDRFSFERERKRLIQKNIEQCVNENSLLAQQKKIDKILRNSGSAHNRLVLMQTLFWDQVINRFIPALQQIRRRPGFKELKSDDLANNSKRPAV